MYIFDLDGTLAKTRENRKLPPIEPFIANVILYKELAVKNDCIVVSGRDEKQSPMVLDFMNEHFKGIESRLILNDPPFPRPCNHEYKRIVFQRLLDEGDTIDGVFDDNPAVGDVCRDLNIPFYLV